MDEELDQIERIFNNAANLRDSAERTAYLTAACQEDYELRARVEKLLRHDAAVGSFLDLPDEGLAVTIASLPLAERPGTQIGPYKLVQEIGEGGMGVVYLAEQAEPVQRQVALKIIKPGMDSREVLARFRAEEQALALMDHPHIAQVHDAGATETGRPYFVMELVHGVPLTDYCDQLDLTTRQRLELFVPICHAVQHAHQKGIVHRDLKPSNILVAQQDGVPVPKIIDFGIAKAIHQPLTATTVFTGSGQIVCTPLYASPEQLETSGQGVDTRSDIYSLGVLLYELLTGATPFDKARLQEVGLEEYRRVLREEEPVRPSTRISTLGQAATTVSARRQTDPVHLSDMLRRELDWIVMKALEKDRTRRYETANDFARDIQRYLHDEPVEACPPSTAYRLQKFVRRHQTAVLAITAVGLALILGAGVAAGQAYRATQAEKVAEEQFQIANEQRQLAEEAATRESQLRVAAEQATQQAEAARAQAEAVSKYLVETFRSPDPAKDGRTVTVAELLDRAARELDTQFTDQPALKAQLLSAIGRTYCGLGLAPSAIPLLERCRDLRQQTLGREHPESLLALKELATAYWQAARYDEALALSATSRELHLRVLGPQHPQTLEDATNRQCVLVMSGRKEEAMRLGEELLPLARETLGPEHEGSRSIMNNLAQAYLGLQQFDKAIRLLEETVPFARKSQGGKNPSLVRRLVGLGDAYAGVGRFEEALARQEEALQLSREVLGPEHPDTLCAMASRGGTLYRAGRFREAIDVTNEAWQIYKRALGPTDARTLNSMTNLVESHLQAGQYEPALRLSQEALQLCQDHLGTKHLQTAFASIYRAKVLLAVRDCDAAAALLDTTVELCRQTFGPLHKATRWARSAQATAASLLGRHAQATAWGEELLRDTEASCGPQHEATLAAMDTLAQCYSAAGRHAEAVTLLEKSLPVVREQRGPEHPDTLVHMHDLAVAYHGVGRLDEAIALHQATLQLRQKVLGADHPLALASMILLGTGYVEQARYAEAEPLLLAASEGYAQRHAAFPTRYDSAQAREACTQLIQLYEKSNQPDKATAWKEKLAALTEGPKQDEASK